MDVEKELSFNLDEMSLSQMEKLARIVMDTITGIGIEDAGEWLKILGLIGYMSYKRFMEPWED